MPDLIVLYEHPQWQQPLFDALTDRGVDFAAYDLKTAAFGAADLPQARLYFNQASPSAYVRGNTRAVPYALALMEDLEAQGVRVINGAAAFRLELSKIAQARLLLRLGIDHPRSVAFNQVAALRDRAAEIGFPAILKPNQGGSGARMWRIDSLAELDTLLEQQPELWLPDNLLLLQEYLPHDARNEGIVRLEFLGGELLYAMRVCSDGGFNLCPSEVCHPVDGADGACAVPTKQPTTFHPFPQIAADAVATAQRLFVAAGLDIGGIEYLEVNGRRVFYDINANSNLRRPVAQAFGFDPFERVVDYLVAQLNALPADR
ncbi:MAG: hypothetical protein EXR77_17045 [Myxococcales bacterium]|nr:hypothetical protein [Myxococcales bacterium]